MIGCIKASSLAKLTVRWLRTEERLQMAGLKVGTACHLRGRKYKRQVMHHINVPLHPFHPPHHWSPNKAVTQQPLLNIICPMHCLKITERSETTEPDAEHTAA